MSRHNSLTEIRNQLKVELRNGTGSTARYNDDEIDLAINRGVDMLHEHFWYTELDTTKTTASNTYSYVFEYPVMDFERVAIKPAGLSLKFIEDWFEPIDGTLEFLSDVGSGETIYVWYQRHPVNYPPDKLIASYVDINDDSVDMGGGSAIAEWPASGYFKIDSEVFHYTSVDRSTGIFTVERAQLDTVATEHLEGKSISFVNRVDKPAFFDGVRDLAIYYLNRMRVVDAPSAEIAGNVTVMREINENFPRWKREHRQRQEKQPITRVNSSKPLQRRRRGS